MPFQIQPVKEFLVRPALPSALARMSDLAYNVLWSWDHTVRSLFRRLDSALWKNCGHNPVLMLGRVPQATLERAAADSRFLAAYRRACDRYSSYLERPEPGGRSADRVFFDGVRAGGMHADLWRRTWACFPATT